MVVVVVGQRNVVVDGLTDRSNAANQEGDAVLYVHRDGSTW